MIGIYKITNKVNGKFYIGQSQDIENRWKVHKRKKKGKTAIIRAMLKYGADNFELEILKECTLEELNFWEIKYIEELKPHYNMTLGGEGSRGFSPSEESRKKKAKSYKKYWDNLSEEYKEEYAQRAATNSKRYWQNMSEEEREIARKKNSKAQKERWKNMTEEEREHERQRIAAYTKGVLISDETRKKLSLVHKKYWENISKEDKKKIGEKISISSKGKVLSEETRKKLSDATKKQMANMTKEEREKMSMTTKKQWEDMSDEAKKVRSEKISKANTGRKNTEEAKKRMSIAVKGRVLTEEHKRKISLNSANKKKVSINGLVFESLAQASRYFGKREDYFGIVINKKKKNSNWYKQWEIKILDKDD